MGNKKIKKRKVIKIMKLAEMKKIEEGQKISDLLENEIYYCKGFDGSANYTVFAVTDQLFIAALAWDSEDKTVRLAEQQHEENFCLAIDKKSVQDLSVSDGYTVLAEFSVYGFSDMIDGRAEHNFYIEIVSNNSFEEIIKEFGESVHSQMDSPTM